jgi:hypothetical protein
MPLMPPSARSEKYILSPPCPLLGISPPLEGPNASIYSNLPIISLSAGILDYLSLISEADCLERKCWDY